MINKGINSLFVFSIQFLYITFAACLLTHSLKKGLDPISVHSENRHNISHADASLFEDGVGSCERRADVWILLSFTGNDDVSIYIKLDIK